MFRLKPHNEQGFTLTEIVVVIAILGILAAIAIPIFLSQQQNSVDSSVRADLKSASLSVESWYNQNPNVSAVAQTVIYPATGTSGSDIAGVRLTEGTTLKLKPSATNTRGYTLCATNERGNQSKAANYGYLYDQNGGQLISGTTTC